MPLFYFDLQDGEEFHPDADGHELDSDERAHRHAARYLIEAASDAQLVALEDRKLAVHVRDTVGVKVLTISISFEVTYLGAQ